MHKRRILVVDGFQAQWVLTLLVWVAALLVWFVALILGPVAWQVSSGAATQQDLETASALLALHDRLWLPVIALFLGMTLVVIKLTHRVAGPLYRFRQVFAEMAKGNLAASAKIRERDYLHQESKALQSALDSVAGRVKHAQAAVAGLDGDLASLRSVTAEDLVRLRERAARAREALSTLHTERSAAARPIEAPARAPVPSLSDAGFSLVEVLLLVCITATLAALAFPAYHDALDRARVTRAIADVRALDNEVTIHRVSRGCFPGSLADIGRAELKDPWGNRYEYGVPQAPGAGGRAGKGSCGACDGACMKMGEARKDKNLVPINADFDLYSMGRDGRSSAPLTAKASQDDIVRGRSGGFVGLASEY